MQEFTLTIGGRAIRTQGSFNVVNPANETVVAACLQGTPSHLDQAVAAARAALPAWSSLPDAERARNVQKRSRRWSSCFAMIVTEHSAESLAPFDSGERFVNGAERPQQAVF